MINLHAVVRGVINTMHPDEDVTIFRSAGQANVKGAIVSLYQPGEVIGAQIQSLSNDDLYATHDEGQNEVVRNCYLFSSSSTVDKPASIIRPLARSGDMIQRSDGTWWLVTALKEDFSRSEWVNVSITLQIKAPDFSSSDWYEG